MLQAEGKGYVMHKVKVITQIETHNHRTSNSQAALVRVNSLQLWAKTNDPSKCRVCFCPEGHKFLCCPLINSFIVNFKEKFENVQNALLY